jgi:hypothetical protein
MKRFQNFRQGLLVILIISFICGPIFILSGAPAKQMYYEIKIYRVKQTSQTESIDKYLKDAFIPAMHSAGISKIGVFKPVETDTAFNKLIYVFIPYKNIDQYLKLQTVLENDQAYLLAGKDFLDAPYNEPPFVRYESILLKAFSYMPQFRVPSFATPVSERIYELRSYESPTEAKAAKKIEMFNVGGEMAIFEKIGANAVFYGQVLMGSMKPRLIYMTTYSDMKSRDEHWKAFINHPDWKTLSIKEEYKNTVPRPKAFLLHPTDYSDF